jgi:hypothetical protein
MMEVRSSLGGLPAQPMEYPSGEPSVRWRFIQQSHLADMADSTALAQINGARSPAGPRRNRVSAKPGPTCLVPPLQVSALCD